MIPKNQYFSSGWYFSITPRKGPPISYPGDCISKLKWRRRARSPIVMPKLWTNHLVCISLVSDCLLCWLLPLNSDLCCDSTVHTGSYLIQMTSADTQAAAFSILLSIFQNSLLIPLVRITAISSAPLFVFMDIHIFIP